MLVFLLICWPVKDSTHCIWDCNSSKKGCSTPPLSCNQEKTIASYILGCGSNDHGSTYTEGWRQAEPSRYTLFFQDLNFFDNMMHKNKRRMSQSHVWLSLYSLISAQCWCGQIWSRAWLSRPAQTETEILQAGQTQPCRAARYKARDFQFSETLSKTEVACASQHTLTIVPE